MTGTIGVQARQRLLDAARRAFADKGFHGTATRDIAAAAGMSPAAVYVHHRSKEALLFEISLGGHRDLHDRVVQVTGDDPRAVLEEMVVRFVTVHAEGALGARVVNYELGALTPEHRAQVEQLRAGIQRRFREVIEAGVASGAFSCPDIPMTVAAILGMGIDVARWYDGRRRPAESIVAQYAVLALRMVGCTAA